MGRIIGYQYDNNVQDGDAWIGSEDGGGKTKQYTAEAVANYLNIQGKISIVGQMTYKYVVTPLSGPGTFAVFGGGTDPVAFSAITKLTLSNTDVSKQRVVEFLNLLVGSDILISKQSAISTFGYYSIDNYAVNATDPTYYDLGVTFKSGNGSMEAEQIYETQNFTLAAEENISTLQTTIDSGNTYQENENGPLWTWDSAALVVDGSNAPSGYEGIFSGKYLRLRSTDFPNYTTLSNGSLVIPLPGAVNTKFRLSANPLIEAGEEIGILSPATSGTLALTTDITASPWDTVLGGINYAGGNVGIGTTNPSAALNIVNFNPKIVLEDSDNTGTFGHIRQQAGNLQLLSNNNTANGTIQFKLYNGTTTTDAMYIASAGNVGIGTTNPSQKLNVAGGGVQFITSDDNQRLFITSSSSSQSIIYFGDTSSFTQGRVAYENSSDSMYFNTASSEKMRILANGNVGIGTTNPLSPLHVASFASGPIARFINTSGTGGNGVTIQGGNGSGIILSLSDYSNIERLRVNGDGNVGIGTTNPTGKLEVDGGDFIINADRLIRSKNAFNYIDIYKGSDASMRFRMGHATVGRFQFLNNANTEVFTIDARNEKVGIGTTAPGKLLEVKSSTPYNSTVRLSTTAHNWDIQGGETGYSSTAFALDYDGTTFFRAIGTTDARFSGGLSVGAINATPPTGGLYVAGNAGIGTTSPSAKLDVRKGGTTAAHGDTDLIVQDSTAASSTAQIQILGGATGFSNLYFSDTSAFHVGGFIYNHSSNYLATNVNGSEKMRITSTGNVGIGTTSPGFKTTIYSTSTTDSFPLVVGQPNSSNEFVGIGLSGFVANNGAVKAGFVLDRKTTYGVGDIHILNNTTADNSNATLADSKLTILQNGNVGIGATGPSEKLDIIGNIKVRGTNNLTIGSTSTGGNFSLSSGIRGFNFANSNGDLVRIDSAGNVGIGTTSPSYKLEVSGDAALSIGADRYLRIGSSTNYWWDLQSVSNDFTLKEAGSNTRLIVKAGGNVGIGTTSPQSRLHIADANPTLILEDTSNPNKNKIENVDGNMRYHADYGSDIGNSRHIFFIDNSEKLRIDTNGNVGIGTTNPNATLDIENSTGVTVDINSSSGDGQLRFQDNGITKWSVGRDNTQQDFVFSSSAGLSTDPVVVLSHSTGNVGIGTTSPTSKLDVAGGDIELNDAAAGIIMRSPDGTKYRITVANGGTLTVTAV